MRVRMLRTQRGSPDGIASVEYEAGESYDLPASLAQAFLVMRVAEEDTAAHASVETTAQKPARASRGKRARKES
jgi:hypothetical protein